MDLILETDTLLAGMIPDHPYRTSVHNAFQRENIHLSPYTLIEINSIVRAGKLEIESLQSFTRLLARLLSTYDVEILPDSPRYHARAREIEVEYDLSFFDSLHGATALLEGGEICSFDRAYDRLKREGLRRIDPRSLDNS